MAEEEEVIRNVSQIIRGLASDASILRDLTSLHFALQDKRGLEPNALCFDKRLQSDEDTKKHPFQERNEISKQLHKMNQSVTQLEQRMSQLTNDLEHEKAALNDLEKLKNAAMQQMEDIQTIEVHIQKISRSATSNATLPENSNFASNRIEFKGMADTKISNQRRSFEWNKNDTATTKKDDIHQMQPVNTSKTTCSISLPLVKQSEFESLSKHIHSNAKINLAVLNEALLDIVRVCRLKYSILLHHQHYNDHDIHLSSNYSGRKLSSSLSPSYISSMSVIRTKPPTTRQFQKNIISEHYQLERVSTTINDIHSHDGRPWVSEESLRNSCSFFRFGEITSRAILSSLCLLGRLRQVNNKSQITYVLLMSDTMAS